MPRKRQPVAALRASGSRHYSKAQLEEREAREVKAPPAASMDPPYYLPASLAKKFRALAPVLIRMGILTSLDGDGLARYLIAEHNYLRATKHLFEALAAGTTAEADKWSSIQDRFFRQCRSAGADLGLTVSGRCSLELPPSQVEEASREEAELFGD